ncbi:DUF1998 domain-containing protein [Streptomyces sp. M10(2022)]
MVPRLRDGLGETNAVQQGVKLLLAHELRSEALRILIPAVTAYTEERLASFKALLLAGIAQSYGGDPDHLAVVTDSMPEPGSDVRRHFLVLYDSLPGGTGYLHRLAGPDGLYDVLTRARQVIEQCPCVGRTVPHATAACCGTSTAVSTNWSRASTPWTCSANSSAAPATPGASRRPVRRKTSVSSSRSRASWRRCFAGAPRLGRGLRRGERALCADAGRRARHHAAVHGSGRHGQRLAHGDADRPRVHRARRRLPQLDDDRKRVAVYLDGYRYHGSPAHNRIASDADKRTRLRTGHGWQVFQLTWDDVRAWTGDAKPPADPVWVPYQHTAQKTASDIHRRLHGDDPRDLHRFVWTNPVETLIGYLTTRTTGCGGGVPRALWRASPRSPRPAEPWRTGPRSGTVSPSRWRASGSRAARAPSRSWPPRMAAGVP